MINTIKGLNGNENIYSTSKKERVEKTKKDTEDKTELKESVNKESSSSTDSVETYKKPKYNVDMETVNRLKNEISDKNKQLKDIVSKLISNQKSADDNLSYLLSGGTVFADADTIQSAKSAISEDGEFGVKKTAERILDFAKAISGGDPSKIKELRKAVEKGFSSVAGMCKDGKLPDICNDTYSEVMKGFDQWEKESKEK